MKILHIKQYSFALGCLLLTIFLLNLLKRCDRKKDWLKQETFEHKELKNRIKCRDNKTTHRLSSVFPAVPENGKKEVDEFNTVSMNKHEAGYFGELTFKVINVIDWKRTDMQTLSAGQIMEYFLWTNQSSCRITQYFGGVMVSTATGLVSLDGQKALCLDYTVRPVGAISDTFGGCVVYSFGINNEWSFDDAMDLYGCKIFSFDPSMNISSHRRTKNIVFYRMALGNVDKNGWGNNTEVPTRTLFSIYNMLSPIHGKDTIIDYLKLDIESAEWQVLPQIIKSGMLDKVRQLALEIHVDIDNSLKLCRQYARLLQWLENYGMVRFDSKPNLNTLVNSTNQMNSVSVFNGYEITWYNNKLLRDS